MNLELMSWSEAAGAQVLQVTLVALIVAILVRIFARSRPHLAYLLWMLVIVKCLTPPLAASRTGVFSWALAQRPQVEARVQSPERPKQHERQPPQESFPLEPMPAMVPLEKEVASPPVAPATIEAVESPSFSTEAILFGLWALGAITLCSYVGLKWVRFRNRVRRSTVSSPDWLHAEVEQLSASLGLRRVPRILICEAPLGPLSMGLWRPRIVLPAALVDPSNGGSLQPVLAHELVHIRRGDVVLGYGQLAAQILWWFHPLVWWANREARRERERCCDETVLARLTFSPASYARTLIDVLDTKHGLQAGTLLPIARASDVNDKRLRHIMRPAATFHRSTPRWCWLAVAAFAALLLPGAGLSLEPVSNESISQAAGDEASISANENRLPSEPAAVVQDDEPETKEPKFSPKHEAAAKRLQELGARYSTAIHPKTAETGVHVGIGDDWTGDLDDWQLLADLDTLTNFVGQIDPQQVDGLDVLAGIETLKIITMETPTAEVIEKLGDLPNLTTFSLYNLSEEQVELDGEDFAPLAKLSSLRTLSIRQVKLDDEAMRFISELPALRQLSVEDTDVTDDGIAQLANLRPLESLLVMKNSPSEDGSEEDLRGVGFGELATLPKLRSLHLSIPTIDDEGIQQISKLQQLRRLNLFPAPNVTAEGINALRNMTGLRELWIQGPKLSGDDYEFLSQLKELRLLFLEGGTDMGDVGTQYLSGLTKLRVTSMPGKRLTDDGIRRIAKLSKLRLLNIPQAQITTDALEEIAKLPELEAWSFDTQQLDDGSIAAIRSLPDKGTVILRGARITDAGVEELVEGDRYWFLNVSGTLITDHALEVIQSLENLKTLHLRDTKITDAGLKRLYSAKGLYSLDIVGTEVTEAGVRELEERLPNLERIYHDFQRPDEIEVSSPPVGEVFSLEYEIDEEIFENEQSNDVPAKQPEAAPEDREDTDEEVSLPVTGTINQEQGDEALNSEDAEPIEPKFSPKHDAAAKRLQKLGATYSAGMHPHKKIPLVSVYFADGWKGGQQDLTILEDLDVVSYLYIDLPDQEEVDLDVVANLDQLELLTLVTPTAQGLATIGVPPNLTHLILEGRNERPVELTAEDYAPVGQISSLTNMMVLGLPIPDGTFEHVGKLRNLEWLHLQTSDITDAGLKSLASLGNLRHLMIEGSPASDGTPATSVNGTGFASLADLPHLNVLTLVCPELTDEGLAEISKLQNIEQLMLQEIKNITPAGIGALSGMTRLKKLDLIGSGLDGDDFAFLANMKNLRSLGLFGDLDLGDAEATHIAGLEKLRSVTAPGSGLGDQGFRALGGLDQLRVLNIPQAQPSPKQLDELLGLHELFELAFDARYFDDACAAKLKELPRLRGLSLQGSRITDEGLATLVRDHQFVHLDLDHTAITDRGLAALDNLETLERLRLLYTPITDEGLASLEQLHSLKQLNVAHTNVSEAGVESFRAAMPGCFFVHDFSPDDSAWDMGWMVTMETGGLYEEILADD